MHKAHLRSFSTRTCPTRGGGPLAARRGVAPRGERPTPTCPLLIALHDLADEGCPYRLTIGLTPVLAEQLADADVLAQPGDVPRGAAASALRTDIARFGASRRRPRRARRPLLRRALRLAARPVSPTASGDHHRRTSARCRIGATSRLPASAATHGYLPLIERDSAIHAQIAVGVADVSAPLRQQSPSSFWLPECAYRPAYVDGAGAYASRARRVPRSRRHSPLLRRDPCHPGRPTRQARPPATPSARTATSPADTSCPWATTPEPTHDHLPALLGLRPPRRRHRAQQPHRPAGLVRRARLPRRLPLPRVPQEGRRVRPALLAGDRRRRRPRRKAAVRPGRPRSRASHEHARHFAGARRGRWCASTTTPSGRYGIVCAAYDTELFGHWWFEGIDWLQEVLRSLASQRRRRSDRRRAVHARAPARGRDRPAGRLLGPARARTSPGRTPTRQWMWPMIDEAQRRMEDIVARHAGASARSPSPLAQAARELLLLESSDWPFLVTTGPGPRLRRAPLQRPRWSASTGWPIRSRQDSLTWPSPPRRSSATRSSLT